MRKGLAALLLVVAVLWASVAAHTETAFGHANQARSAPSPDSVLEEAPTRVAVWFTEPIEPALSDMRVLDSQGVRVDDGESLVDPADGTAMSVGLKPLPDGTYTVAWKNVSTIDGHLVRGSFLLLRRGAHQRGLAGSPKLAPAPVSRRASAALVVAAQYPHHGGGIGVRPAGLAASALR